MLQSAITFILRSFSDSGSEWVIMRAPSPAAAASEAPVTQGIWFKSSMVVTYWLFTILLQLRCQSKSVGWVDDFYVSVKEL